MNPVAQLEFDDVLAFRLCHLNVLSVRSNRLNRFNLLQKKSVSKKI